MSCSDLINEYNSHNNPGIVHEYLITCKCGRFYKKNTLSTCVLVPTYEIYVLTQYNMNKYNLTNVCSVENV